MAERSAVDGDMPVQFQQSVPIQVGECSLAAKAPVSKTAIASSSLASPATSSGRLRTYCRRAGEKTPGDRDSASQIAKALKIGRASVCIAGQHGELLASDTVVVLGNGDETGALAPRQGFASASAVRHRSTTTLAADKDFYGCV
jgi:hypothetical protein